MKGRLEVGRVARPHGVQGELVVELLSDRVERLSPGSVLYAGTRPLVVAASRPFAQRFLVWFVGVEDRTAADALHGQPLFGDPIDDPDALWVHELIGSTVEEVDGTVRGIVVAVQANPASDLLVLDSGALVPEVFVQSATAGKVVVDTPPGLFELG